MRHIPIGFAIAIAIFLAGTILPAHAATTYPLKIDNCGETVVFDKPPQRIVSIGQGMSEILFSLGLADRMVGTAVWVGPILPQFEEANRGVKRLADNDPSFESVVKQTPDLVAAEFEWHLGPEGSVGRRDQFAGLGINTYVAPTDCTAKRNGGGGDGRRGDLFTMELVYREIAELSEIFDVEPRGDRLIAELRAREAEAVRSVAGVGSKALPVVFWFSSKEIAGDAFIAGKNGAPAYILAKLGAKNVVDTEEEWPLVGWETISEAAPAIIVIATMERRRYPADDPKAKIDFLTNDPVTVTLDAVRNKRFVLMDAQSMNPTIRTIDGIETLASAIRRFGLTP